MTQHTGSPGRPPARYPARALARAAAGEDQAWTSRKERRAVASAKRKARFKKAGPA
ncbi:MAG: hypothetical protein WCO83_02425 [Alphaproteobacteria bacterium]